jgi:hypothetical protein
MTNMNDWNKLMRNRGAIAALEELRDSVTGIRPLDGSKPPYWRVLLEIDTHIAKYK